MIRYLVVTADDYGLTPATCRAIVRAHREGVVTATAVLANAPATAEGLAMLHGCPDLAVGVHLALVGEDPPLTPPGQIPSLVDREGRFRIDWRRFVRDAARGSIRAADVRRELDAQLAFVADHLDVAHLNMHQHLQLWPSLQHEVASCALRHGIPYVRTPGSSARGPRGAAVQVLAHRLRSRLRTHGVGTNDAFLGLDEAGAWDADRLRGALSQVRGRSVEVNLHLGEDRDRARDRYRWGYAWGEERAAALSIDVREAAEAAGFELVAVPPVTDP